MKTICTTNCTWSATLRMVNALVGELGVQAGDGRRAFPTPAAMAEAPTTPSTPASPRPATAARTCAASPPTSPSGRLDLELLADPALPDDEVAERLLALPGVGPYATAHMMMLLGRYRRLILDSWTRPTYRRLAGRPRVTDKGIQKAFRRYREYAGLAFWLTLTRDWVTQGDSARRPRSRGRRTPGRPGSRSARGPCRRVAAGTRNSYVSVPPPPRENVRRCTSRSST